LVIRDLFVYRSSAVPPEVCKYKLILQQLLDGDMSPMIAKEMAHGLKDIEAAIDTCRNNMLVGCQDMGVYRKEMEKGNRALLNVKSWAKSANALIKSLQPKKKDPA